MIDVYILKVANATDYSINVNGTIAKYLATAKGAQIGGTKHTVKSTYNMTFNNNPNVTYAVRSLEN